MEKSMKILYDSNVIAIAFLENVAMHKTGIFRYAENLARNLKEIKDVNLTFFSSLDQRENKIWKNRLSKISYLQNVLLFNSVHPLKSKLDTLSQKMLDAPTFQRFFLKSYRESLRMIMNSTSHLKSLKDYDLFFSPYHPIPKKIQEQKNIVCFTAIHDLIPLKYPKFFKVDKRAFFDRILKKSKPNHFFLALSESTKADICHYYSINPEKIFVVHSAPQSELFYPVKDKKEIERVKKRYKVEAPYILSLATLEPRKNISFLIDAFIKLIKEKPSLDLKLVLCGAKGWGYNEIFEKIKEYEDRVIITGFVKDEDLAAIYSGALAFVYPSLYEGFGLPPLEAMKCETPVIVSDRSSLPEVVGKGGLYVDPTDIDDMANQIYRVFEDKTLREDIKEKAKLQLENYNWEKSAKDALNAFESALKQVG